jgi:hypothetical protein
MQTVWAYKPMPELGNKTGFVLCDEAIASPLIAAGDVQDPRSGSLRLRHIERSLPQEDAVYETKVMTPRSSKAARTKKGSCVSD